jgi:hypothetical protein
MDEVKEYLLNKRYPENVNTEFTKRNFRRKCQGFKLKNGVLLKDGKRVLFGHELEAALESVHSQTHGGHLGVNKT